MKFNHFAAGAAVLLVLPAICCSCKSGTKPESETPEAVEIKAETAQPEAKPEVKPEAPKTEVKQEVKPEAPKTEPAAEVKAEPAGAKAEPVLVPETKKEAAPARTDPKEEKKVPPCEHTVHTGDSLWKISIRYYGSGAQWKRILEANKAKIKKADHLEPGTVLTIPAAK